MGENVNTQQVLTGGEQFEAKSDFDPDLDVEVGAANIDGPVAVIKAEQGVSNMKFSASFSFGNECKNDGGTENLEGSLGDDPVTYKTEQGDPGQMDAHHMFDKVLKSVVANGEDFVSNGTA
ncbi:hypothetical protein U1Q18_017875 [Sarracenia purpurea var. burkii]